MATEDAAISVAKLVATGAAIPAEGSVVTDAAISVAKLVATDAAISVAKLVATDAVIPAEGSVATDAAIPVAKLVVTDAAISVAIEEGMWHEGPSDLDMAPEMHSGRAAQHPD